MTEARRNEARPSAKGVTKVKWSERAKEGRGLMPLGKCVGKNGCAKFRQSTDFYFSLPEFCTAMREWH